ncbi:23S rRNA (guanosine(2251)-2'-O)-methyltransferase RlmB [Helicobacter saguini]|uniref:23S rRNA (Guanosine(2251)-2'-O)-methyltransferase RlmB n=1 Tax=Helicobacter saguini TaxID=1548018 RepID=A0A347VQ36_9HELI|nr:23S rRNA (guanosine(2251)-2'-O)-methyltransferase RlmB [Helicobacter saguini]MWV61095.1 23S rRNA (guanosine(2251)-2'-O)-methyltransferase RlmB [Helicobacter saguini]MWV68236.1 23S rRNA (guanosine(2251)-2'-O)-methyltransferase RlmB [Helicobacter saguini]MWV70300.1 23S rRNA (guanosine(2251)-2'-O)-methyltransferase RlmB [Helicobacter saguini]MWV72202.1 23S rRNA (guanosine(2251)-2'-O)-methyltransferase RlmB [Helicobacter saguini]TLD95255.1 23S rRNA (guanosine(2251)-2'-O)-methyltransferase RlmB 
MIIFGKQCVLYVLENSSDSIKEIYLSKEVDKGLFSRLKRLKVPILRIDNKKAQGLSKGKNHQGLFAKISPLSLANVENALSQKSLIVLCGVSDVGNIGNIVRTSYALGVGGVVVCDINLSLTALESVFRASSGALLSLPFCVLESMESRLNTLDFINQLQGAKFRLFGSGIVESALAFKGVNKGEKWALFLGSEDVGLHKKVLNKMDSIISIKMQNNFNSLNVSVACGILVDRILQGRI